VCVFLSSQHRAALSERIGGDADVPSQSGDITALDHVAAVAVAAADGAASPEPMLVDATGSNPMLVDAPPGSPTMAPASPAKVPSSPTKTSSVSSKKPRAAALAQLSVPLVQATAIFEDLAGFAGTHFTPFRPPCRSLFHPTPLHLVPPACYSQRRRTAGLDVDLQTRADDAARALAALRALFEAKKGRSGGKDDEDDHAARAEGKARKALERLRRALVRCLGGAALPAPRAKTVRGALAEVVRTLEAFLDEVRVVSLT
jgi:hypothetical protein